ncbi:MAG TPA: chemotaxis protein CheB [Dissulfurispiraceae bacterium]|nr:chemotaxis protein CheB [Dissulfurispiraceae bacterium]
MKMKKLPTAAQKKSDKASKTPSFRILPAKDGSFPIVGIGASAGGLEALELFLGNVPPDTGIAFIIILHLDPTHKGVMAELLQRSTPMPCVQAKDRIPIKQNTVYIIPPNTDMSILRGKLHLFEPTAPRGLRLPIDFFFRSLATDRLDKSIGVILSGMGSDGTLGLRAIKEKAGVAFVQSPSSAKFDGMPRSAIDAGIADVVLPVEELPQSILSYLKYAPTLEKPDLTQDQKAQGALEKIIILLRSQTGHDFSMYKKSTIYRRIERRMGIHQIERIAIYLRYLQENPQEVELLFKELLIGVTSFFRDPAAWEQLKEEAIPEILATHQSGDVLRTWAAGSSTGEEAFSLAVVFKEVLEKVKPAQNIAMQIFATDLDSDAIDKARAGVYLANIAADVSPERLRRFFVQDEHGGYRVGKGIRESVIFAQQNMIMDPPFTKLDLIICRNVLIYLEASVQKKLLRLFHYCLNPGGYLFLGTAETTSGLADLFSPLEGKNRIFRRLETSVLTEPVDFPSSFMTPSATKASAIPPVPKSFVSLPNFQTLADQLLLQGYSPPAVLTTDKGDIVYISGRTGKYLEPAAGKANWNIFAMSREGLRYDLTNAFQKALRTKNTIVLKDLKVGINGGTQIVDIVLQPLAEPVALKGMVLIVFRDSPASSTMTLPCKQQPAATKAVLVKQMEEELQRTREELQTTHEEMQTSQEELKSANEELQSTNEELQSTNEELTTSKEEMQSLNEELQTVNNELQAKVDELSRANNDMKNLLNSTDIATLFLDDALNVRRFTTQITSIIKLIPGDVGRPITDIVTDLDYPALTADARQVLQTLVFMEKPVPTHDGRYYQVRIMPYRTLENRIDGVVITFSDISWAKQLEDTLRKREIELKSIFEYMPLGFALFEPVLNAAGQCADGRIIFINGAFERILGVKGEEVRGRTLSNVWPGAGADWGKACVESAASGLPAGFNLTRMPGGQHYHCRVFRSGEIADRFGVLIDETAGP